MKEMFIVYNKKTAIREIDRQKFPFHCRSEYSLFINVNVTPEHLTELTPLAMHCTGGPDILALMKLFVFTFIMTFLSNDTI